VKDSFNTKTTIKINSKEYLIYDITKVSGSETLPFSLKILLENLLRSEDDISVSKKDILALVDWKSALKKNKEIAFRPARVLMQDFTGVPAIVDLAAMRDAVKKLGGNPDKINPLQPAELVIDHSIQVDNFGDTNALDLNSRIEFQRNAERYKFLKWGQNAFNNFKVVPPDTGIVHQVNLEYLARVVFANKKDEALEAYPDTVVGTDSHTTMINGVGVLGWGVGGIEAEAAMLGQPISMLIPSVVGFKLTGKIQEGATATDLVLTIVEMLRKHGVVGKFVEFYGPGLDNLSLGDRATIANMAPEYGATCGIFPIDKETINYLKLTNRDKEQIDLIEAYAKKQTLWRDKNSITADYSENLELDLSDVEPCLAGPKRPQDKIPLSKIKNAFLKDLDEINTLRNKEKQKNKSEEEAKLDELKDGSVVIAAITSCTNTSNPSVMLAAGLMAKKAASLGIKAKPWVKTSLAPGSKAVTEYLKKADVLKSLEQLGFYIVGYGCTTCIGNSGPLLENVTNAIKKDDLTTVSVLSGNRNFEGRIHAEVQMNYLASPPLVVAYAIAGNMNIDILNESICLDNNGNEVFLNDIWPTQAEIEKASLESLSKEQFKKSYIDVYKGEREWANLESGEDTLYSWEDSTYVVNPPYFENMQLNIEERKDIHDARVLVFLGDSITTDHISPAGAIKVDSPAGLYLQSKGVLPQDFNSYGSRRGNHEVMMRGTFANIRLRNKLTPKTEGGMTLHFPNEEEMPIYDAAMLYKNENTPSIIIAGKEYGCGSSRDWAAKGPLLQGVNAVIAESFERIHRSNLVGMGILPLEFLNGDTAEKLGLSGKEVFHITNIDYEKTLQALVTATLPDKDSKIEFNVNVKIDTPQELEYYRNGGILHYVLRQLAA
jgi:aconitate hydratase